ncbi:hypothetical protein NC651_014722 [Populus alba x Populus x berolinensis]|nr:hypothetical protein NC651_014722 [Populus alba x Populus x berolinensis]
MVQEPDETRLQADNTFQKEKAESSAESKSNQQTPKRWSNLRKILILKRFIKALEKVRNFSPQKPRNLNVEADPESRKKFICVIKNHGREKNSEEWMLDHALQQVISTLAPAQKRKVALLVQAFETVTLSTEVGTSPGSNIEASSHANSQLKPAPNQDQASDFYKVDEHIRGSCSEVKETSLKNGCIHLASSPSSSKNTAAELKNEFVAFNLGNGETNSAVKDDEPDFVSHLRNLWINGETLQEDAKEASALSASGFSVPLKESSEVAGEENELQGSTLLDDSEPGCTTDAAREKQKHKKFWFLIYKHMVSGNATLLEGADNEEQGDGGNKLVEMNTLDNDDAGNQKIKLQQIEAIRLVEEAIDQIPLPEFQEDSPDDQSVACDIIQDQDQEHTEKKAGEGEEPFHLIFL